MQKAAKSKKQIKSAYINCLITGKKHYIYGPTLTKKIAKFGSLEEFQKHFISGKAKKLLKEGLTQQQVREKLKVKGNIPDVEDIVLIRNKIKKINKREKKEDNSEYLNSERYLTSKRQEMMNMNRYSSFKAYVELFTGGPNGCQIQSGGTCQYPNIWFDNDEHCDGCSWYEHCLVKRKRLMKKPIKNR